jgi:uncharacterized protein
VYYKNRVIMEDTLEQGLERIFQLRQNQPQPEQPQQPQEPTTGSQEDAAALIARANTAFRQSQDAMKSGNWTEYGARLKELEDILNKLNALTNQGNNQQAPIPEGTTEVPPVTPPVNQ